MRDTSYIVGSWTGGGIAITARHVQARGQALSTRSAFVRGGCWALAIGLPILSIPMIVGWLKPGPTDPRVYTNLLLMLVFCIPIFVFGGFIGMFRALSRQAQSTATQDGATSSAPEAEPARWAHERTHEGTENAPVDTAERLDR
jgi:hypothetical protein